MVGLVKKWEEMEMVTEKTNREPKSLYIKTNEKESLDECYVFATKIIFTLFPKEKYQHVVDYHHYSLFDRRTVTRLAAAFNAKYLIFKKPFFRYSGAPRKSFSMQIESEEHFLKFLKEFGKAVDDLYIRVLKNQDESFLFDRKLTEREDKYLAVLSANNVYYAIVFLSCVPCDIIIPSFELDFTKAQDIVKELANSLNIRLQNLSII